MSAVIVGLKLGRDLGGGSPGSFAAAGDGADPFGSVELGTSGFYRNTNARVGKYRAKTKMLGFGSTWGRTLHGGGGYPSCFPVAGDCNVDCRCFCCAP